MYMNKKSLELDLGDGKIEYIIRGFSIKDIGKILELNTDKCNELYKMVYEDLNKGINIDGIYLSKVLYLFNELIVDIIATNLIDKKDFDINDIKLKYFEVENIPIPHMIIILKTILELTAGGEKAMGEFLRLMMTMFLAQVKHQPEQNS